MLGARIGLLVGALALGQTVTVTVTQGRLWEVVKPDGGVAGVLSFMPADAGAHEHCWHITKTWNAHRGAQEDVCCWDGERSTLDENGARTPVKKHGPHAPGNTQDWRILNTPVVNPTGVTP